MADVRVRLPEPWETTSVVALPPGWANVYHDRDGALRVEPCPVLMLQSSERRKRLVYATASPEHDGELTRPTTAMAT